MTTTQPDPKGRPRPLLVSLVATVAMLPAALALAALALINLPLEQWLSTAICLAATTTGMVLGACLGAAYRGKRNVVHVCMAAATGALLVVGFPVFLALEPVYWRFGVGLIGPIFLVGAASYGAPVALASDHDTLFKVVAVWLWEPWRLIRYVGASLFPKSTARGNA